VHFLADYLGHLRVVCREPERQAGGVFLRKIRLPWIGDCNVLKEMGLGWRPGSSGQASCSTPEVCALA